MIFKWDSLHWYIQLKYRSFLWHCWGLFTAGINFFSNLKAKTFRSTFFKTFLAFTDEIFNNFFEILLGLPTYLRLVGGTDLALSATDFYLARSLLGRDSLTVMFLEIVFPIAEKFFWSFYCWLKIQFWTFCLAKKLWTRREAAPELLFPWKLFS